MFKFNNNFSKYFLISLISLISITCVIAKTDCLGCLSISEVESRINQVEQSGAQIITFLENIDKDMPSISSDLLKLKGNNKFDEQLLNTFLALYAKSLKLSDLKDFMILKNNKDLADKLIVIGTHITLNSVFISLISNLEKQRISNQKSESIETLNNLIDSFIQKIETLAENIRNNLVNILKTKFQVSVNGTNNTTSTNPEIIKILKALKYEELNNFFKIEKMELAKRLNSSIEAVCHSYLNNNDITTLSKLTSTNAFTKIKNVTTKKDLSLLFTTTQNLLPKSAQNLTTESFKILKI